MESGKLEASRWFVDCKSGTDDAQFGADDARGWSLGTSSETPATSWLRLPNFWKHENCQAGCRNEWQHRRREDVDESRHQRQHNVNDPQHEKLVEEIVEVVQIISQKHLWVQCNCLTVTFSSVRVAPRKWRIWMRSSLMMKCVRQFERKLLFECRWTRCVGQFFVSLFFFNVVFSSLHVLMQLSVKCLDWESG